MKQTSYLWVTVILLLVSNVWLQPLTAQNSGQSKWMTTGNLLAARTCPTATLLPNGRVLIVGGYSGSDDLATAELYQPDEGVFVRVADMSTGRTSHTATLLKNGLVLVVGGQLHGNTLASAELYNPATDAWTTTGSLHLARSYHTATLLSNGQVLVVGGAHLASPPVFAQGAPTGSALDIAELYDPISGKWTVIDNLNTARYQHTATLLKNGDVLVTGGIGSKRNGSASPRDDIRRSEDDGLEERRQFGDAVNSAELYNHVTKTWTVMGSLLNSRYNHTATLLPNGQVLVTGGQANGNILGSSELYNVSSGTWTPTGSLHTIRNGHTATLLPGGQVLVVGGANNPGVLTSAELYNPPTGTWETAASMNTPHSLHTATLFSNGQVFVAGGSYALGSPAFTQASAELYGPVAETAQVSVQKPALPEAVHACPLASDSATKPLLTLATCLVIFTVCLVILTACVVILLSAWLVFVLIQRWRK